MLGEGKGHHACTNTRKEKRYGEAGQAKGRGRQRGQGQGKAQGTGVVGGGSRWGGEMPTQQKKRRYRQEMVGEGKGREGAGKGGVAAMQLKCLGRGRGRIQRGIKWQRMKGDGEAKSLSCLSCLAKVSARAMPCHTPMKPKPGKWLGSLVGEETGGREAQGKNRRHRQTCNVTNTSHKAGVVVGKVGKAKE